MKTEDDVRKFIKGIDEHFWKTDYKEMKIQCTPYFAHLPIPDAGFTNRPKFFGRQAFDTLGSNVIYRAHKSGDRPFDTVKDLSYVPKDLLHTITDFGRVNEPGESMFYGSSQYEVACTETLSKGNYFEVKEAAVLRVGVWKFETSLNLVHIPRSEKWFKYVWDRAGFKSNSIQFEDVQKEHLNIKEMMNDELAYELLVFFADEFAKMNITHHPEYKLSKYYADRTFNSIKECDIKTEFDGIIYPSVSFGYQHKNIVLKPEVVDSKLKFQYGMSVMMVDYRKEGKGFEFIPFGQRVVPGADGKFIWQ